MGSVGAEHWQPHRGLTFPGGSRERQVLKDAFEPDGVLWAAGLFVGEGYASVRTESGRPSANLAIKMLDWIAVELFADVFGLRYLLTRYDRDPNRFIFTARANGSVAIPILHAIYPFICRTDKGAQVRSVLEKVGAHVPETQPESTHTLAPQPRRRVRELLDRTRFDQKGIVWAAGLFVGEGWAGVITRRRKESTFRYPALSVSMLDEGAVQRFGGILQARPYSFDWPVDRSRKCHRVQIHGSGAEACLRAMYPHLRDTDKGKQVRRLFDELGLELAADGSGETWTRRNGLKGRKLTAEHIANISAGRKKQWERWRERNGR